MINRTSLYQILTVVAMLSSLSLLTSCDKDNKKEENEYTYSTSEMTTLVTGFALQTDAEVLASLDSVHFTVDYDRGVIYNADSLPVGTDITGLKVTVEFLNTVNSAVFTITDASKQADTTINYARMMSQKLDFTGRTILTVTSADKSLVKDYEVKVLVHKMNPDSLIWNMSWRRDLPGYLDGPVTYKVVKQDDVYRAMVYNGEECNLLTATSPAQGTWDKQTVALPFEPQVSTLSATSEALYVLADDGTLYSSTDGLSWTSAGVTWYSLLGSYDNRVLGIVSSGTAYYHDEFPRRDDFESVAVASDFPVSHSSGMIVTDNDWALTQQAMLVGGMASDGRVIADVWGYDGISWGKINNIHSSKLPAMTDATLFPYYTYKALSGVRRYGQQETWYVMGGRLADGTLNDDIYLSNTQGITWTKGDSTMCQPEYMPQFYGAQAFVDSETLTASALGAPRRISTPIISWDCPYIYLFGGYNNEGVLLPYVWRGVYNRLTNQPVY